MKIVSIREGLGNQMFQYAFALILKERYRHERILIDPHYLGTYECHNGYELDRLFDLKLREAKPWEIALLTRYCREYKKWIRYREQGSRRKTECFEPRYGIFVPNALDIQGWCYYDGYWQASDYFAPYHEVLKRAFVFKPFDDEKNKALAQQLQAENSVIMHVRRGDYVGKKRYEGTCAPAYYQQAFNEAKRLLGEVRLFVFSNDIPWCRQHLPEMLGSDNITFVDHNVGSDSYRDMQLMTYARFLILANSSFSWWGAFLNNHPDKLVVAPSVWINLENVARIQEPDWIVI